MATDLNRKIKQHNTVFYLPSGYLNQLPWPVQGIGSLCGVRREGNSRAYLTECIDQSILESQLPPKIVNLLLTMTD